MSTLTGHPFEAFLREQADTLDECLAQLAAATEPDTVERAVLVVQLRQLLERYGAAADARCEPES